MAFRVPWLEASLKMPMNLRRRIEKSHHPICEFYAMTILLKHERRQTYVTTSDSYPTTVLLTLIDVLDSSYVHISYIRSEAGNGNETLEANDRLLHSGVFSG